MLNASSKSARQTSQLSKSCLLQSWWMDLLAPLLFLGIGSALLLWLNADLNWTRYFYLASDEEAKFWARGNDFPFQQLYDFGVWPALTLSFVAILGLILMQIRPQLLRWRKLCLYWLSCLALGPGLVVNAILKEQYGRPRPRDSQEFGGRWPFEPLWQADAASPGKSFTNGHASMGFILIALFFILRAKRPKLALACFAFSLIYGALIGTARLAQGGHFPTDTLWSAGLLWLICALLARAFQFNQSIWTTLPQPLPKPAGWKTLAAVSVGACLLFLSLLALPANQEKIHLPQDNRQPNEASLLLSVENSTHQVTLQAQGPWQTQSQSLGHGLPGSEVKGRAQVENKQDGRIQYEYKELPSGLHAELVHNTHTFLPSNLHRLRIRPREKGSKLGTLVLHLDKLSSPKLEVKIVGETDTIQLIVRADTIIEIEAAKDLWKDLPKREAGRENSGNFILLNLVEWIHQDYSAIEIIRL